MLSTASSMLFMMCWCVSQFALLKRLMLQSQRPSQPCNLLRPLQARCRVSEPCSAEDVQAVPNALVLLAMGSVLSLSSPACWKNVPFPACKPIEIPSCRPQSSHQQPSTFHAATELKWKTRTFPCASCEFCCGGFWTCVQRT